MPTIALQAHFDGKRIVLDEAYDLPVNANLIVTVLPNAAEAEEGEWLRAAATNEAFEFLWDPAEDIYTIADGQPIRNAV